jgi:ubiquinone/menaquinone biosynthesis C-methylase UbiE
MRGAWGAFEAWLYSNVVAGGSDPLYARFVREALSPLFGLESIVDIGCGAGQVTRLIAERNPGWRVLGLDLAPQMIRRARRLSRGIPNLRFEVGDVMDLPLEDGSVDLVVSVASIKHWPDQVAGLRQIRRVLRPLGNVCILEVDRACSPEAARTFVDYWRYVLPGTTGALAWYFRRFVAGQGVDADSLSRLMERAGFGETAIERVEQLPFVVARGRPGL